MTNTSEYLHQFISRQLSPQANEWFEKKYAEVQSSDTSRAFFLAFGMTPKKTRTEKLQVNENSLTELQKSYPGFNPSYWTIDQLCRVGLMSAIIEGGNSLAYNTLYIFLAIGFGSITLSWMNDSGFWVVQRLSGFTEKETLKTWSVLLTAVSVCGLVLCLIGSTLIPLK